MRSFFSTITHKIYRSILCANHKPWPDHRYSDHKYYMAYHANLDSHLKYRYTTDIYPASYYEQSIANLANLDSHLEYRYTTDIYPASYHE